MEKGPPPPYAPPYDQVNQQQQQYPIIPAPQQHMNSYGSYGQQPVYAAQPQPYPTVIQVGQPVHTTTTTVIVEKSINHCLHCFISLLFPPWIFVWIFLCLTN